MATTFIQAPQGDDLGPMVEMNTTPLIDVLLVLLIMLIITIPVQSHVVKLDLPLPGPSREINRLRNEVVVTKAGALLWNGEQLGRGELAALLDRVAVEPIPPEVHLRPDPQARYEEVDDVLAIARRAHVRTLGFVGNENYARF